MAIALVDVNNFYASCERLFRPELRGRPIVVLSNNDGCVVSRSPEAKAMGIKMAGPYFKIRDQFEAHGGVAFSSNYALYGDMSGRVMSMSGTTTRRTVAMTPLPMTRLSHVGRIIMTWPIRMRLPGLSNCSITQALSSSIASWL